MTAKAGERLNILTSWIGSLDQRSHYELFGIEQSAASAEVKRAFHLFALSFHPDRYQDASEDETELARRIFARGVKAYQVLRNRDQRAEYDLNLARGTERSATQIASNSSPVRSLVDLCQTPAAKLPARQAEKAIHLGALGDARRYLMEAISKDGGLNPELEARLDDLELALHAMGTPSRRY
jgi:curved DNA-binding protein CbpA